MPDDDRRKDDRRVGDRRMVDRRRTPRPGQERRVLVPHEARSAQDLREARETVSERRDFFHVDDPEYWLGRHLVADITVVSVDESLDDAHLHINGERMHVSMKELRGLVERGLLVESMVSAEMLPPMKTRRKP